MTTSFDPVLTTTGLKTAGHLSVVVEERGLQRLVDVVLAGVADEIVRDRHVARAVGDDADFDGADLVAIDAGRLLADLRRGGAGRHVGGERREGGHGCTGERGAAGKFGHGPFSLK